MFLSLLQVIKWIDEHGEPFLDKHTDVGMTAEKAEALLKRHEEFEAIAKVSEPNSNINGIKFFANTLDTASSVVSFSDGLIKVLGSINLADKRL